MVTPRPLLLRPKHRNLSQLNRGAPWRVKSLCAPGSRAGTSKNSKSHNTTLLIAKPFELPGTSFPHSALESSRERSAISRVSHSTVLAASGYDQVIKKLHL